MDWKMFYKDCFGHQPEERRTTWNCVILMATIGILAAVFL